MNLRLIATNTSVFIPQKDITTSMYYYNEPSISRRELGPEQTLADLMSRSGLESIRNGSMYDSNKQYGERSAARAVMEAIDHRVVPAFATAIKELGPRTRNHFSGFLSNEVKARAIYHKGLLSNDSLSEATRQELLHLSEQEDVSSLRASLPTQSSATEPSEEMIRTQVQKKRQETAEKRMLSVPGRVLFCTSHTGSPQADVFADRTKYLLSAMNLSPDAQHIDITSKPAFDLDDFDALVPASGADAIVFTGHGSSRGDWDLSDCKPRGEELSGIEVQSAVRPPADLPIDKTSFDFQIGDGEGRMKVLSNAEVTVLNASHDAQLIVFNTCFSARMAGEAAQFNKQIKFAIGSAGPVAISFADNFSRVFLTAIDACGIPNTEMAFHITLKTLDILYKEFYNDFSESSQIGLAFATEQIHQMRLARRMDAPRAPFLGGEK